MVYTLSEVIILFCRYDANAPLPTPPTDVTTLTYRERVVWNNVHFPFLYVIYTIAKQFSTSVEIFKRGYSCINLCLVLELCIKSHYYIFELHDK